MSAEAALAYEPALPPAYEEDEETQVHAASLVLRLRGLGIADVAVLRAMETVPRTLFVPPEFRHRAYAEHRIPIDCGQTIDAPTVVAEITAALDLCDRHSVLELGTGSGFHTAVLAQLARRVTTIERFRTLARAAERRFQRLEIRNISTRVGDGLLGWRLQAPFDRIVVGAACPEPPVKLIMQLTQSGVLIAPIGTEPGPQRLTLFQRIGHNVDTRDLGPCRFSAVVSGPTLNL
jgi:protein-L-isoaspartate(D-aspartate) O-methyltransferase